MTRWPALDVCETELTDPDELYLRQVHPIHCDNGQVGEYAFLPTRADNGKLSGARSSISTPELAYRERVAIRPGATAGTWAVSVAQAHDQNLRCVDDSACDTDAPTGHTYLDLRILLQGTRADRNNVLLALAQHANQRGRLYPTEETP